MTATRRIANPFVQFGQGKSKIDIHCIPVESTCFLVVVGVLDVCCWEHCSIGEIACVRACVYTNEKYHYVFTLTRGERGSTITCITKKKNREKKDACALISPRA